MSSSSASGELGLEVEERRRAMIAAMRRLASSSADLTPVVEAMPNSRSAMESLCSFYESCAQFEVDEFRDYDKAVAALREASNAMNKSQAYDKTERLVDLDRRIEFINTFLEARSHSKDVSPNSA